MSKVFNRALKIGGEPRSIGGVLVNVILEDLNGRPFYCSGETVPTSGDFAKGSIFVKTNAADGTKAIYENQGTTTTPSFNLAGDISAGEITLADSSSFNDSNGNELLAFGVVASAVNYWKFTNSATGNPVLVQSLGDDANINVRIEPKGTGLTELYSDEAGATGSVLRGYHDSASPATSDVVFRLLALGEDSASNTQEYGRLDFIINTATNGSESGQAAFYVANGAGVSTLAFAVKHDGTNGIAEVGDGVGNAIVRSAGNFDLIIKTGNATTGDITLVDGANGDITATLNGTGTFKIAGSNKFQLGATTTISSILDEDNMASDSATALATQQSIKAYVDTRVATVDTLNEVFHLGSSITVANTENLTFTFNQNDVTNNPNCYVVNNAGTGKEVLLTNTNGGATGVQITTQHHSPTPVNSDIVMQWSIFGRDVALNSTEFARITAVVTDTTDASEDGDLEFYVIRAGTVTKTFVLDSDVNGIVVGSGAGDGIVQSSGNFDLIMRTGNATTGSFTIADGADGNFTFLTDGTGQFVLGNATATCVVRTAGGNDLNLTTGGAGVSSINIPNAVNSSIIITPDGTGGVHLGGTGVVKLLNSQSIADANENELLSFIATGSAVNEFTIVNAATGNKPKFQASGSDANIGIRIEPKGTGATEFYSDETGAVGSTLESYHESASPAIADNVFVFSHYGNSSTAIKREYAKVNAQIVDATNGVEYAYYAISTISAGTIRQALKAFYEATVPILEVGDGSVASVIQSSGNTDITLRTGNATTGTILISNGANGNITITPNGSGKVDIAGAELHTDITTTTGAGVVAVTGRVHAITTDGVGNAMTLADGVNGQRLTIIYVAESAGADTAILTPTTLAGSPTIITFNALGDAVELIYYSTGGWYVVGVNGAIVS